MPVRIITIGKKHEPWVADGIDRYHKRLKRPYDVTWEYLPHSAREGLAARQEESERLLGRLGSDEFVVLLDERGKNIDSPSLSTLLQQRFDRSQPVTLLIGGAYGVDDRVHARADFIWSLSLLVFPHQLVRLLLIEQLYRAQEIAAGHPYHHS